jgi:hypothetical protein
LLPELPQPRSGHGTPYRDASLEELAQTGALVIRRAAPRSASTEGDIASARARRRILTSQDIARAVPPSRSAEIIIDEVHNPAIRAGDVLVPLFGRRLTARVAANPPGWAQPGGQPRLAPLPLERGYSKRTVEGAVIRRSRGSVSVMIPKATTRPMPMIV